MAQTNIDAIAEFKVLTSSVPGRVRPRGRRAGAGRHQERRTQNFSGFGLLVRPPLRLERQHLDQQPRSGTPMAKSSRNDSGYTIGGPVYIPAEPDKKKLFFFWSQEFQRRKDPVGETRVTVPTDARARGRLLAERRHQRQPVSVHPRLHDRPALQRDEHARLLPGRRRPRQDPGEPPVRADARRPEHLPDAEHAGPGGLQLHEPDAGKQPARTRPWSAWTTS